MVFGLRVTGTFGAGPLGLCDVDMTANWVQLVSLTDMETSMRVVVVGTSGSGKTSFARAMAKARGVPHIELDSLHWAENWTERSTEDFIAGVEAATAGPDWVADGNYSAIRHVLWPRATDIVWLNYGRVTVFSRILRRTLVRVVTQQELWAGNRESFRKTFLSRDSVLLWSVTTFGKNRVKYANLRSSNDYPHLRWHEFRHPTQATDFLAKVNCG